MQRWASLHAGRIFRVAACIAGSFVLGACASAPPLASPSSTAPAIATSTTTPSPPSATPSSSPSAQARHLGGRIVFARAGGEFADETVFIARADGTQEQRITDPGAACCPRWSPDGTTVLLSAKAADGKRITSGIIEADGSRERLVPIDDPTLNLGPGAFFPDGKRLLFQGWDDAHPDRAGIYAGDAAGGGLVRLTTAPSPDLPDLPMDVAPDGSRVFFFRSVQKFPSYGDVPEGTLFSIAADGTKLTRITPSDLPVELVGSSSGRLSRDGRWVTFTSSGAIWVVRSDGSGAARVLADPAGRLALTPTWSPDGHWILFGLDPAGQLGFVRNPLENGLYVVAADGTGDSTPILESPDFKREPDWIVP